MAKSKYPKPKYKYKSLDDVVDFGYVKGMTVREVIERDTDRGFMFWALSSVKEFRISMEIKEALEKASGKTIESDKIKG